MKCDLNGVLFIVLEYRVLSELCMVIKVKALVIVGTNAPLW